MAFWVDWLLWQKLCLILGLLITAVFVYALGVLGYNNWKMRKFAATEAQEREKEAEMYPMLHDDDIPFGARALERGIEVAGIWNSNPGTPIPSPRQPGTPVGSRPASLTPSPLAKGLESQSLMESPKPVLAAPRRGNMPGPDLAPAGFVYETTRPGGVYGRASLPVKSRPIPIPNSTHVPILSPIPISPAREESLIGVKDPIANEKRVSFHSRVFDSHHNTDVKDYRSGLGEPDEETDYAAAMMGIDSHPPSERKRVSLFTRGLRRRSSEEFRRKMSQIFNENMPMAISAEQLEFNPALREYRKRDIRKSLLRPFRPWMSSSENESK